MNLVKKVIPILAILLLTLSSFLSNPAFASTNNGGSTSEINKQQTYNKLNQNKLDPKEVFSEDEKVRVIVELTGETAVDYATKNNILYKDLAESKKIEFEQNALAKQSEVQSNIQSNEVALQIHERFTTIVNGFSGEVKFKDIDRIKSLPEVKDVYISTEYNRPLPQPEMNSSHEYIQSTQTWGDAKYKGEGTVVSIIDSGVDPSHKDFTITDSSKVALTQDSVNQIISEDGLPGQYHTEKVPYGYNYYDKNQEILDLGPDASMHGMHVAGTAAANGDTENSGIKGVAPEAQVLGMKVFSNDANFPSTWDDIYLKAIDDSIKLGADVINMSLGSTAAYYQEESIANVAITKAVDNGIVVSVSAGNSGHIGYGFGNPLADNPDIGVVGSPGLSKDSLQVAATGNTRYLYETDFNLGNGTDVAVDAVTGYGADDWQKNFDSDQLEVVTLGGAVGQPADYEGIDVEGKVVLVQRGAISFYDKTINAAEAGAVGIIVYDHGLSQFYKDQGGWAVPFMKVHKEDGEALEKAINNGNTTLTLEATRSEFGPEVGQMTEFTSWGTTPSLELKPEISAPGGHIYSTLNNDSYGMMSGTSMAAPHVTGGTALVMQYLGSEHSDIPSGDRARFAKVLLMNSADVILDDTKQPFSPRRQGAGMMQTYAAVTTPVSVVDSMTGEAKVELFDFSDQVINMSLTATNHSNEDVTYNVGANVLTDTIENGVNQLIAGDIEGATVTGTGDVTVPANSAKKIEITIDLTGATMPGSTEPLVKDNFVEGFITLNHDTKPNLSVPYVGFYGDWDRPDIFDGMIDVGEQSYYGFAGMLDQNAYFLPANDQGQFAISPNGDGYADATIPLPTLLRNARTLESNILDSDKNELRTIRIEQFLRKSYFDVGYGSLYSFVPKRMWDGTDNFELVEDGLYYYELKGKIDYDGAEWQYDRVPVVVDTVAPQVQVSFDEETNTVNWQTTEEGSGVFGYDVYLNGESVLGEEDSLISADKTSYKLPEGTDESSVMVAALDYAQNFGVGQAFTSDDTIPYVYLESPAPLTGYGSKDIEVYGTVTEPTLVSEILVNGEPASIEQGPEGEYFFSSIVSFEENGTKDIKVKATDVSGNEIEIARTIFVDSEPGTITMNTEAPEYVAPGDEYYEEFPLDVTLEDDYRQMEFYVNDNFAYGIEFDVPLVMDGHTHQYQEMLQLEKGLNTFYLTLEDLGGNVTTKEVNIYKLDQGEEIPEESVEITDLAAGPSQYVSTNRPTTITASASEEISWNVKVYNPDNEEVESFTAEGTAFAAVYTPGKFALNGEYTVKATGTDATNQEVAEKTTTFTVYNYSTMISEVNTMNALGESQSSFTNGERAKVKAEITNLEDYSVSPMLIVQVLDEDNRVVSNSFMTMDELYAQGSNGLGYEIDVEDLAAGTYTIESFVWTGWDMGVLAAPNKGEVTFQVN